MTALKGALGPNQPGGRLAALYGSIADSAGRDARRIDHVTSEEYRVGAGELVGLIAQLPALQAELDVLAVPPSPSPTPPSAPPARRHRRPPPPRGTPQPPTPVPIAPRPSSPVGSPAPSSPAANEQIENGGFETGVGPPWGLFLGPGANASVAQDPTGAGAGAASARIDIDVRQPGLFGHLVAPGRLGARGRRQYSLSISRPGGESA